MLSVLRSVLYPLSSSSTTGGEEDPVVTDCLDLEGIEVAITTVGN